MAEQDKQSKAPESQPDETSNLTARVAELEQQLAEAQQKAEENWNQFLRSRAEMDNVRRRSERELEQAHKFAIEKFAAELLAVKDSLEMGVAAAQEGSADLAKLREGSELTLKILGQVLDRFSVTELNPQGQRFNPSQHEAMAAQESGEHEPNTVLHVVQKGYQLGERLLRPAMVIVSRPPAQPSGGRIDEQA